MKWHSAKIRLACLIEGEGVVQYTDSIFVFKATGYQDAKERAIALGKKQEEEYHNAEGSCVRWRLKEIISLDALTEGVLDGTEIYSEPVKPEVGILIPFDVDFKPEDSKPTQTI